MFATSITDSRSKSGETKFAPTRKTTKKSKKSKKR
jgi:hypothetical protein